MSVGPARRYGRGPMARYCNPVESLSPFRYGAPVTDSGEGRATKPTGDVRRPPQLKGDRLDTRCRCCLTEVVPTTYLDRPFLTRPGFCQRCIILHHKVHLRRHGNPPPDCAVKRAQALEAALSSPTEAPAQEKACA